MAEIQDFKDILNTEIKRLTKLCEKWERIALDNIPEEIHGNILSVIGQTKLLIRDKLPQFRDLINVCTDNHDGHITLDDLRGFWDLVYIQIEDVNKRFTNLDKLQVNHWMSGEAKDHRIQGTSRTPTNRQTRYAQAHTEAAKIRLATAKLRMREQLKNCSKDCFY